MTFEKIKKVKFILVIFLIALVLRVLTVFLTHYWLDPGIRYKLIPPDAREYSVARAITKAWEEGRVYDEIPLGAFPRFDFYKAAVFMVTGYNYVAVPLVNALLGALAVFFIYGIARRLFNEKVAYLSITIYTFFPSLIFWSSQNLKDMPSIFIVIVCIWASVRLREPFRPAHLLFLTSLVPLLYALNELRCYIFLFLLYGITLFFLISISKQNYIKNILYALFFFMIICFFPKYTTAGILSDLPTAVHRFVISGIFKLDINICKDILKIGMRHNRGGAIGGAAIYPALKFSSASEIIRYLPTGITYFLFAPFPWKAKGLMQLATVPENLFWYVTFPFVLWGIYISRAGWKKSFAIFFFIAVTLAAYSLYEGNFGTGYRHKAILMPFFFVYAGGGITHFIQAIKQKRKAKWQI